MKKRCRLSFWLGAVLLPVAWLAASSLAVRPSTGGSPREDGAPSPLDGAARPTAVSPRAESRNGSATEGIRPPSWVVNYQGFFPSIPQWVESDVPVAMVSPGDGRVVIAGTASHRSDKTYDQIDNILVLGLGPAGSLDWKVLYPSDPYRRCNYLTQAVIGTRDKGYLVLATREDRISSNGAPEPMLMKLNVDGTIAWIRSYQLAGGTAAFASALTELIDGRLAVAASAWDKSGPLIWTFIADPAGNVLWSECLRSARRVGETAARAIWSAEDGGFILAGSSAAGNAEVFEFGPSGAIEWQTSLSDKSLDGYQTACEVRGLAPARDGGYFLAGKTRSYNDREARVDDWLAKVDGNGNLLWQEGVWGSSDVLNMVPTSDGGFLYCGRNVVWFDAQGQSGSQRSCNSSNFVAALPYAPSGFVLAGAEPLDSYSRFRINAFLTNEYTVLDDNCVLIYSGNAYSKDWQVESVPPTPLTVVNHQARQENLAFIPYDRPGRVNTVCPQDPSGMLIRSLK